ncbi:RagB/SusD family nutrient uptake outer membrane protein [Myroides pelagicus]|uniref:RagB/SusD family nutrient uptake outer membrane protein n=1 Tax=Myroides pelagicus TaxID=270914 RepID=UPI002DB94D32|nr:RagB/SusD family nutrient uptake outer membrane protein [Myroides pelagicus]MEC4114200.1 RagB/SusD family nutrient uptake outer membrane protein [Myroides pelagicus]
MKRVKIIVASLLIGLSAVSCDNFLSELPDNRAQLDSKEKISDLLVSAYPIYGYAGFTEIMSDNADDCGDKSMTRDYNLSEYKWELEERTSQDSPSAYWDGCYEAIASANDALEAIEKLGGGPELSHLKGEALVARAYAHFMLVQIWSKAYNPATADSDVGIPYVDKPERVLIQHYDRGTVADVYAKIEKDLEEGLPLLKDSYKQPKFHFNRTAGHAFASNFYLVKGDWAKVLEHSDYLASNPKMHIRDYVAFNQNGLMAMFTAYSRPTVNTNLLLVTAVSNHYRNNYASRFWVTPKVNNLLQSKNPYGKRWLYPSGSFNGQTTYVYPKLGEYFRLDDPSAGTGLPHVNYVLLSNDENFLNRIEALAMSGRTEEAFAALRTFTEARTRGFAASDASKFTMNYLKSNYTADAAKLAPYYDLTEDQAILVAAVLAARQREFVHEGKRWFDVKRHNIEVVHKLRDEADMILTKDDLRRQLPLPLHVVSAGIPDNPR